MRALFSFGFRPFFLLASSYAVVAVVLWTLVLRGVVAPSPSLPPFTWHAHEMLFGFVGAALAGFLLTAVRNWTNRSTLHGLPLAALALVWLIARVLAVGPYVPLWLHVVVDAGFFVAVAVAIGLPLLATRSVRNYGFPLMMLAMGAADVGMHLPLLEGAPFVLPVATAVALHVPLVCLVIVGGRIVPMFTKNALLAAGVEVPVRNRNALDQAALVAVVGALFAEVLFAAFHALSPVAIVVDAAAGALMLARMRGWGSLSTWRRPVLAVLHVGWAMLGAGYLALACARAFPAALAPTTALHVLTIGGVALFVLGMMSRVALGHTGRPLVVSKAIVVAYGLVVVALVLRVVVVALLPEARAFALDGAAAAFALAFALYFLFYLPVLVLPRVDEPTLSLSSSSRTQAGSGAHKLPYTAIARSR